MSGKVLFSERDRERNQGLKTVSKRSERRKSKRNLKPRHINERNSHRT